MLSSVGLVQHVDHPTHKSDGLIDIIVSRSVDVVSRISMFENWLVWSPVIVSWYQLTIAGRLLFDDSVVILASHKFRADLQRPHESSSVDYMISIFDNTVNLCLIVMFLSSLLAGFKVCLMHGLMMNVGSRNVMFASLNALSNKHSATLHAIWLATLRSMHTLNTTIYTPNSTAVAIFVI